VRQARSCPLVDELHTFLRERRAKLSGKSETAKAIDYSLMRWDVFTRFIDDGRLCMTNNAAERELRAVAVGRNNWTFAGSDDGGRRAAAIYTLIQTARLNGTDPQAWLADVLARLPRSSGQQARRPAAMELEAPRNPCRCLIALINRPSARATPHVVFTGCVRFGFDNASSFSSRRRSPYALAMPATTIVAVVKCTV
jgi:flagellar biosynthesis regulator FlaF